MLSERATQYREHWEAKGREPPTKDEWYEIAEDEAEAESSESFERMEVAKDEKGVALSGAVKALPSGGGEHLYCSDWLVAARRIWTLKELHTDPRSAQFVSRGEDPPTHAQGHSTRTGKGRRPGAPVRRGAGGAGHCFERGSAGSRRNCADSAPVLDLGEDGRHLRSLLGPRRLRNESMREKSLLGVERWRVVCVAYTCSGTDRKALELS